MLNFRTSNRKQEMFCVAHFWDISHAAINNHCRKSELPYQERLCDGYVKLYLLFVLHIIDTLRVYWITGMKIKKCNKNKQKQN